MNFDQLRYPLIREEPIHLFAAKGFEVATESYERGRPDYPTDAIDCLIRELELSPDRVVADLGAGTGKLTKLIKKSQAKIIAIEPVEGMRKKFSSLLPEIEILDGVAEHIPLESQSLDAFVVGQAIRLRGTH